MKGMKGMKGIMGLMGKKNRIKNSLSKLCPALLIISLWVMYCFPAWAESEGVSSLEELCRQAMETQSMEQVTNDAGLSHGDGQPGMENNSTVENETSGDYFSSIADAAKLNSISEGVSSVGSSMNSWGAKLMQFIGYILSIGLGLATAIDLCFIAIPPLRAILANGYTGNDKSLDVLPEVKGLLPMKMGKAGVNPLIQNPSQTGQKTQWVSYAALNAITTASCGESPLKVYLKQRLGVILFVPVLFTLAATGVLSKLGFILGNSLALWGNGIGG